MSATTISFTWKVGGVATDVSSAVLSDPTGTFGVKRTDTDAVVVADGTALTKTATGTYQHTFTDPAAGLTYNYYVEVVYLGQTYHVEKNLSGPPAAAASLYLSTDEAVALAATLPATLLAAWSAAGTDTRLAALVQATLDIDAAGPWQGRRYDLSADQVLEFPRIHDARLFDQSILAGLPSGVATVAVGAGVWDWDADAEEAVVPANVKKACLYQAESILAGVRGGRMDAIHDGVNSQSVGGMSESYAARPHGVGVLCRLAEQLMARYRLRSGRLL